MEWYWILAIVVPLWLINQQLGRVIGLLMAIRADIQSK